MSAWWLLLAVPLAYLGWTWVRARRVVAKVKAVGKYRPLDDGEVLALAKTGCRRCHGAGYVGPMRAARACRCVLKHPRVFVSEDGRPVTRVE